MGGMNDRETVALILLGHQYGRCHREVSGYEGPWWAANPTKWNSDGMGFMSCAVHYDWEYEENPCARARPMNPRERPAHYDADIRHVSHLGSRVQEISWHVRPRSQNLSLRCHRGVE